MRHSPDMNPREREKIIIRTSIIGIIANVFLAAFKAFIGLGVHSIAIVMDAVNNLSDAMSSLITILGTRLASKRPDRKHPLGHGRIEYLSAMVIAGLVIYAGITAFIESVKKIIDPQTPDYSTVALIIVAAAVLVKIILGRYVKSIGQKVNSDALIASGTDASFDAVLSASTLAAAIVFITTGLSLEAWLGAVISLFIVKAGVDMLKETISEILGERVDPDIAKAIRSTVNSFPEVSGAYDLVIHNYGPSKLVGSIHIEVPENMTAAEIDKLSRQITEKIYTEHGIIMTGISVYSRNMDNEEAVKIRKDITEMVMSDPDVLEMHGFYLDELRKEIQFDIIINFDVKERDEKYRAICRSIQNRYPDYDVSVVLDLDMSD